LLQTDLVIQLLFHIAGFSLSIQCSDWHFCKKTVFYEVYDLFTKVDAVLNDL